MNHIYRSLYNKALGTWVAVPEIAKTHGKSAGGKSASFVLPAPRFAISALAGALLFAFSGQQALAADYVCVDPATGQPMPSSSVPGLGSEVACGEGAVAAGRDSIAIGTGAKTADAAQSAIAIGTNAEVTQQNSFAFGANTKATGANSLAVGNAAKATGQSSAAFGDGANASAGQTTAVGVGTAASAAGASAFGHVAKASGEHSTAIGSKAEARGKNSVALGYEAGFVESGRTPNLSQLLNVVNIGNGAGKNTTSNIHGIAIGVGAGQNVATAANGGQNTAIGNAAGQNVTGNTNVAISSRAGQHVSGHDNFAALIDAGQYVAGRNNIAIGKEAGRGTQAKPLAVSDTVALGYQATGGHNGSIAIGKQTVATSAAANNDRHSGLIAIGDTAKATNDQAIAIGKASASSGDRSIAMGAAANAAGSSAIAFGTSSSAANKDGIAIGNNAKTGTGDNNTAVGAYAQAHTGWSTAVGTRAHAAKDGGFAGGKMAYAKEQDAVATGAYSYANGAASTAIGYQSIVADNAHSSTAIGTGSVVSGTLSGVWNATTRANANAYNNANRSYVGGDNNYAIGNKNIIGDQTSNTFILGNNVKLGATSATLNSTNPLGTGNNIGTRGEAVTYTGAQDLDNMVALGSDTKVSVSNGVALGYGSNAATDKGQVGADPLNAVTDKTGAAWTSTSAAVSIGDAANNITRQITDVAAGTKDTDAVNVAQLKAVANALNTQIGNAGTHYYSVNDNGTPKGNYNNDGATADRALAAGVNTSATAFGATAVGNSAVASDLEAVAVGTRAAASSTATVAIGEGAKASNTSSIAIGLNTEASGSNSFVLGSGSTATAANRIAKASGNQAVAMGYQTQALGTNSTAIGANATAGSAAGNIVNATALGTSATASAANSLAVGAGANAAGASSVAVGRASKTYTGNDIAIGSDAEAGVAGATDSSHAVAMGRGAKATQMQAVAIGNSASVTQAHGVALGSNSVANVAAGVVGADPLNAGTQNNSTWKATHAALSIGNGTTVTRQITSVAAGTNDTDAVNVAQLKTVANHTKNVGDTIVNVLGGNAAITPQGNISMSDIGGTGQNNIHDAIRHINNVAGSAVTSVTSNDKSITVVPNNNAYDLSVNTDNTTIVKDPTTGALKANTTAINTVPAGQPNAGQADVASADAGKLATAGDIANAINNSGFTLTTAATAEGTVSGTSRELVNPGETVTIEADKNIKVTQAAGKVTIATEDEVEFTKVTTGDTVMDGNGVSITNGPSITKNGIDAGNKKIINVAAGSDDNDAVNFRQLKDEIAKNPGTIINNTYVVDNTTVSAGKGIKVTQNGDDYNVALADDITVSSLNAGPVTVNKDGLTINNNTYVDANGLNANDQVVRNVAPGRIAPDSKEAVNGAQLHALGQQLGDVDKRARAGIASAMASAGLPQAYRPGANMVAASAGHYDGQTAIAIGASTISDNGRWILKGTLNVNSKDAGATVGVGYQW